MDRNRRGARRHESRFSLLTGLAGFPEAMNPDQLRYMSLTFGYLPNYAPGTPVSTLADIDGENPAASSTYGPDSYSIVTLADSALAQAQNANGNVTLVVNVTPATVQPLANGLAFCSKSNGCGVDGGNYTVKSAPIIVLDLTQFGDFWDPSATTPSDAACTPNSGGGVACSSPLILTVRSTMPASTFTSSAFSVPYSTAEYTDSDGNGAGFMGPYAPQVDYAPVGAFSNTSPTCTPSPCTPLFPPPPTLASSDLPATGGFPSTFPGANMNISATGS